MSVTKLLPAETHRPTALWALPKTNGEKNHTVQTWLPTDPDMKAELDLFRQREWPKTDNDVRKVWFVLPFVFDSVLQASAVLAGSNFEMLISALD